MCSYYRVPFHVVSVLPTLPTHPRHPYRIAQPSVSADSPYISPWRNPVITGLTGLLGSGSVAITTGSLGKRESCPGTCSTNHTTSANRLLESTSSWNSYFTYFLHVSILLLHICFVVKGTNYKVRLPLRIRVC